MNLPPISATHPWHIPPDHFSFLGQMAGIRRLARGFAVLGEVSLASAGLMADVTHRGTFTFSKPAQEELSKV